MAVRRQRWAAGMRPLRTVTQHTKAKRQRNPPRACWWGEDGADQGNELGDVWIGKRHAGRACSRMRGMFCFTLKNPAVACGQIAVSHSRRHSQKAIP